MEGTPRLHRGPRAGDRLPDATVTHAGTSLSLQRAVVGPHFSALLCGDASWDDTEITALARRHAGVLRIYRINSREGDLQANQDLLERLSAEPAAQYLVRPDGYIAFRCGGANLGGLTGYLARWMNTPARG